MTDHDLTPADADRLAVLDRIADRLPELNLEQHETEWMTLPDGAEALLVDGGGVDGRSGAFFANGRGDELHAYGPMFAGTVGCVVIKPDGTRILTGLQPDPTAEERGA